MAYWTSVQKKTVSPCELFPYPKILLAKQKLTRKSRNRVHRTLPSQRRCTQRQWPRAIIIPAIHCRTVNLTRIYHSNLCRDTAVVAMDSDPAIASQKLQTDLLAIQDWFNKLRMKANESKSIHITFTTRKETCPAVHISSVQLPQEEGNKYLGLYLDWRLTWHKHIFAKRKQLGIKLTEMYWLLGRK
jgi:hypothetical protein